MPIELIKEEEKICFEIYGAKIFYRRIPQNLQRRWVRECTNRRNVTDWGKIGQKAMEYAVLDWEGVEADGKKVDYNPDLLDFLPGAVIGEFTDVLLDGLDSKKVEEVEKNSKPTPANS